MCGIAGLWAPFDNLDLARSATAMAAQLVHRGPDDQGVWTGAPHEPGLAHRRLSIIDLSTAGHQPMTSPCGRWVLVYNGEVYNFAAMRASLEAAGHTDGWRGHSDSEVLARHIAVHGVEATARAAIGMFAFAAWDRESRELWLLRDRIGIKPLYWGQRDGQLCFGSELRAFRPVWPDPRIDVEALALYVRYGYVPGPFAIYQGVDKVAPGHLVRVRARETRGFDVEVRQWWSLLDGELDPIAISEDDAREQLETLLHKVVSARLVADVEVGAFLSGGV